VTVTSKVTVTCYYNHPMRKTLILCILFATACGTSVSGATPVPKNLKPYLTLTSTATASQPDGLVVSVTTPLPSPTPFTYTIKSGDTLGQLAEKFNVSLYALMAANPNVDPNSMSIGQTLKIPSVSQNSSGALTPTPIPFPVKQIACYPTTDKGMWCFVLIDNNSSNPIEDVTAQITLMDANGKSIASQTATLPLDILPPNSSLPLTSYFAPDIPLNAKPQVQILTAIQIQPNDPRYLPASLQKTSAQVDASGWTAQVNGQVLLAASSSSPAKLIWVAAVAYDEAGGVVGVRRWESTSALSAGSSLPFSFMVSSIAGPISRVEFAVEARP
jgi:LysM repeat protein